MAANWHDDRQIYRPNARPDDRVIVDECSHALILGSKPKIHQNQD